MRDRELMDAEAAEVSTCKASLESQTKNRQPSPPSPCAAGQRTTPSPTQRPSSNPGQTRVPAPPMEKPPAIRRPSRGASPKPPNDMTFPIGRPSGGGASNAADFQSPACSFGDLAGAGPSSHGLSDSSPASDGGRKRSSGTGASNAADLHVPACGFGDFAGSGPPSNVVCDADTSSGRRRPSAASNTKPAGNMPDQPGAVSSPSFGAAMNSHGADGGAGLGRSPSFGDESELSKLSQGCAKGRGAVSPVLETTLPLYDWPFASSESTCDMSCTPANESQKQKACGMPEILPPLKQGLARSLPAEKCHDVGSYSAGISLGVAPMAGKSLKSPRTWG